MTTTDELVEVFADAGVSCARHGVLGEALDELRFRCQVEGLPDLVHELTSRQWLPVAKRPTEPNPPMPPADDDPDDPPPAADPAPEPPADGTGAGR